MVAFNSLRRWGRLTFAAALVVAAPLGVDVQAQAVSKCTWVTADGGIKLCGGRPVFDGGGEFHSARDKAAFRSFALKRAPKEYDLTPGISGFLRWAGGACVYQHGASGNWSLECGTEGRIRTIISGYIFDPDGTYSQEIQCKNVSTGAIHVVDAARLGVIYPNELCAGLGTDWKAA